VKWSDWGLNIRVVVIAAGPDGTAGTAASAQTDAVAQNSAVPEVNLFPAISGDLAAGETATVSTGTWSDPTPSLTYQWQRCLSPGTGHGEGCTDISDATSPSYTIEDRDVDHSLRVLVTATNADGATAVITWATDPIPGTPPSNDAAPSIDGAPEVGKPLIAAPGHWNGTSLSFSYAWSMCSAAGTDCTLLPGATSETYVPTSRDLGQTLQVAVRGWNQAGTLTVNSPVTTVVTAPGALPASPQIIEASEAGDPYRLDRTTLGGVYPSVYDYRWERCDTGGANCAKIAHATAAIYTAAPADNGSTLRLAISRGGGSPVYTPVTAPVGGSGLRAVAAAGGAVPTPDQRIVMSGGPDLPPDVYDPDDVQPRYHVWTAKADGSALRLANGCDPVCGLSPALSPSGDSVALDFGNDPAGIGTMDLSSGKVHMLLDETAPPFSGWFTDFSNPAWTPDGKSVIYTRRYQAPSGSPAVAAPSGRSARTDLASQRSSSHMPRTTATTGRSTRMAPSSCTWRVARCGSRMPTAATVIRYRLRSTTRAHRGSRRMARRSHSAPIQG
jgi:hypothetical protein